MTTHRAFVGLGSNLGNAADAVERACEALGELGTVARRSSLYRTKPWGKLDQPEFVNAAALLETELTPVALLRALKAIEKAFGRVEGERWGPRAIDLDLLAYDDLEINEDGLQVPHPQLRERAFVLVPLAEIEPKYTEQRNNLPQTELEGVRILTGTPPLAPRLRSDDNGGVRAQRRDR
jgi:2-amino-4-hydroxy-6-hydroxymethyldihydropteridine diphosphokinase